MEERSKRTEAARPQFGEYCESHSECCGADEGNFKDVRFYPIFNFGHFWAALLKTSGFYPTRFFRQFWADPIFSVVTSTFLVEVEAQKF